jgi:L-lysine exporter family protein LysE/ArgO
MNYFLEGFLLQASLIMALGAQNIFVLESGLKKEHHIFVAFICSLCDTLLIAIGVVGAATIFIQFPILKIIFGVLGVLFLIYYGIKKLIESFQKANSNQKTNLKNLSLKKIFVLAISFSLLNPHVYLDTIVLIGGYSARLMNLQDRLIFGLGAASFSTIWFFGLSMFAYFLGSIFNDPKKMKLISFLAGVILIFLSFKLGLEVYSWVVQY